MYSPKSRTPPVALQLFSSNSLLTTVIMASQYGGWFYNAPRELWFPIKGLLTDLFAHRSIGAPVSIAGTLTRWERNRSAHQVGGRSALYQLFSRLDTDTCRADFTQRRNMRSIAETSTMPSPWCWNPSFRVRNTRPSLFHVSSTTQGTPVFHAADQSMSPSQLRLVYYGLLVRDKLYSLSWPSIVYSKLYSLLL